MRISFEGNNVIRKFNITELAGDALYALKVMPTLKWDKSQMRSMCYKHRRHSFTVL